MLPKPGSAEVERESSVSPRVYARPRARGTANFANFRRSAASPRARTRRTMNFVNIRGLAPADARTRCGVNFDNFRARRSQKIGPSAIARAGAPSLRDARENACRQAWRGKRG